MKYYIKGFLIPDFLKTREIYLVACVFGTDMGDLSIFGGYFSNLRVVLLFDRAEVLRVRAAREDGEAGVYGLLVEGAVSHDLRDDSGDRVRCFMMFPSFMAVCISS